jgi:hypothetical protein
MEKVKVDLSEDLGIKKALEVEGALVRFDELESFIANADDLYDFFSEAIILFASIDRSKGVVRVYAADYNDSTKRYEVFEYTFKVAE